MDGMGEKKQAKQAALRSPAPPPELVSCFHCTPANIFHVNGARRGAARRAAGEGSPNRGYIGKTTWSEAKEASTEGRDEGGRELLSISESA